MKRWTYVALAAWLAVTGGCDGGETGPGDAGLPPCPVALEEGTPCPVRGQLCGAEACTDPCARCTLFECGADGRWASAVASPPPCFGCGDALQCPLATHYCERTSGGATPTSFHRCVQAPAACGGSVECACLDLQSHESCRDLEAGVQVSIDAP